MQQIIVAEQGLVPTTPSEDLSTPESGDVTGGLGELTGQTPEQLLENVDPQMLEEQL